ncbi:MAG: hypothetical protein H6Q25_80 [Bacteroidetes bacterium]|nr:hypothetical protein [Bacteroidota bacterium]
MKRTLFIFIFLLSVNLLFSQNSIQINGVVKDIRSGEVLIGATILDSINKMGTYTDNNGYFSLVVQIPCTLKFSYLGYTTIDTIILPKSKNYFTIYLEQSLKLNEYEITAKPINQANKSTLLINEIENIPSLGGKVDIGRALQTLPGISGPKEGSSTLLIRGGDPGQNMYLFDNVPVLYVNHLAGFFSVFNPDIINSIDVYKGDFPAKFGGKISSFIDITQKEGNNKELNGNYSIGLTDLSFAIEGPISKYKSSFIITARKTLIEPLLLLATSTEGNSVYMLYGFHDINGKYTWKPNDKNVISYNLYYGDDYLNFRKKNDGYNNDIINHNSTHIWGNVLSSVQWKSIVSPKLFLILGASYTKYRAKDNVYYTIRQDTDKVNYNLKFISSVDDFSSRIHIKYDATGFWNLYFGIESCLKKYVPIYMELNNNESSKQIDFIGENVIFLNNEIKIKKLLLFNIGARLTSFINNKYYNFSLEPRVNIKLNLSKNHTFFIAYSKTTQNNHLLLSGASIIQNEIWFPADNNFKPSSANHYSIGWEGVFFNNRQQSSILFYYKDMQNLCSYKEGYSIIKGDDYWLSKIEKNGVGKSVGIEFYTKLKFKKIQTSVSYTYSKTTRQYEHINNGKVYAFDFDRPHDFSITLFYQISSKIQLNLYWTFQTGLPYTPVLGKQISLTEDGFIQTLIYGEKNSERLKNYHRLDISLNYTYYNKNNRKSIWSFSIYNVYNRKNPYYYYYNNNPTSEIYHNTFDNSILPLNLYQICYFPIIPSFSYKVFFDQTNKPKIQFKKFNESKFKKWLYYEN